MPYGSQLGWYDGSCAKTYILSGEAERQVAALVDKAEKSS